MKNSKWIRDLVKKLVQNLSSNGEFFDSSNAVNLQPTGVECGLIRYYLARSLRGAQYFRELTSAEGAIHCVHRGRGCGIFANISRIITHFYEK